MFRPFPQLMAPSVPFCWAENFFFSGFGNPGPTSSADRLTITSNPAANPANFRSVAGRLPTAGPSFHPITKNSGKFYAEGLFTLSASPLCDIGMSPQQNSGNPLGSAGDGVAYHSDGSATGHDTFGTLPSYGPTWGNGDVIGVAMDLTARLIWFSKNGTFVGNPAAGTGGLALPAGVPLYFIAALHLTTDTGVLKGTFSDSAGFAHAKPIGFAQLR